jgi:hypothetical protein
MLRVMRDDSAETSRRDDMAKAAAPYVHAKLASVEHGGEGGGAIKHAMTIGWMTKEEAENRGWA